MGWVWLDFFIRYKTILLFSCPYVLIVMFVVGALCYAELGTLITKSGAEYSYILESFGGLLAFLFSWISVFVLKPAMLSIICLTLSEYIVQPFFPECQPDSSVIKLFTIFFIGKPTHSLFKRPLL